MSVFSPKKKGMSIAALAVAISISWGGFASAAFAADGDPAPAETTPVVEVLPNPAPAEVTAPDTSSVEAPAAQEVSTAPSTEAPAATEPETSAPSTDAVDESTLVSPPADSSSDRKVKTPECINKPGYSYTFDSATGSGDITVTGGEAGAVLCAPLSVRAVAYSYDLPASGSPSWPQTQVGYNDVTVGTVGTFHYAPPQVETCRQYDVHASFDGFDALAVPEHLLGSHDPYEPAFLHETLKKMGPNPTYSTTTSEGCNPPPPPPLTPKVCTTVETGPTATNLDAAGWYQSDTRATGDVSYVEGGVRFQTTDTANPASSQNKATLYRAITPTPLSEFGEPSVTFASGGSGVKPGMQVGVDVDGNGTWDGYLVGEPDSYGAHNWWVNKPGFNVPSGNGYTSFGSWADFVAANPAAMVIELGLSLGSGVVGDWTVTNLTAGCVSYTFDYAEEQPPVTLTPVGPTYTESTTCGVAGTYDIPGATLDGPVVTTTDPETGVVTSLSSYSSEQGGYNVVDTTPTDGDRTVQITFVQIGEASIAEPGPSDEYVIVTIDGVRYAQWTHAFIRVTVCPTIIPTPPAPVVVEPTCSADGSLPTLVDGEGFTAAYDRPFNGPGAYKAVYTVTGLNEFATGKSVSYDLTVKGKTGDCPTTVVTGNTPPKLAYTGVEIAGPIGLALALLSLGALLVPGPRRFVLGLVRRVTGRFTTA